MKHVYLDQNKWIDLARTVDSDADEKRFADVALLLRAGVDAGHVSLPLSSAHYMETQNRRDWRSRRQLGETMIAFSELHTIAPQDALLPTELDIALREMFGAPPTPRGARVFGVGASHAFDMPIPPYRIPDELRNRVADPVGFERQANEHLEKHLLIGPSPQHEEAGIPDYEPLSHLEVGERYADAKQNLREMRKAQGWNRGERSERVARAQALTDHLRPIEEAMSRAGLGIDELMDKGQQGMSEFVEKVPTVLASSELERHRHVASEKPWERQDLTDIGTLCVAIVHCDVIVTENVWTDAVRRSKLDERFGTVVISRLEDLAPHLLD